MYTKVIVHILFGTVGLKPRVNHVHYVFITKYRRNTNVTSGNGNILLVGKLNRKFWTSRDRYVNPWFTRS